MTKPQAVLSVRICIFNINRRERLFAALGFFIRVLPCGTYRAKHIVSERYIVPKAYRVEDQTRCSESLNDEA